jgi:hypothetical protein
MDALFSVVVRSGQHSYGVDLAAGSFSVSPGPGPLTPVRAEQARARAGARRFLRPDEVVVTPEETRVQGLPYLHLNRQTGMLRLEGVTPPWQPFVPLADGKPALQGHVIARARQAGNVLAVVSSPDKSHLTVRLFFGPNGTFFGVFEQSARLPSFTLSRDGRLLAREVADGRVEVREVGTGLTPRGVSPRGKTHPDLAVELGEKWLIAQAGKVTHLIRWDGPDLALCWTNLNKKVLLEQALAGTSLRKTGVKATHGGLPAFLQYDMKRFAAAAVGALVAAVDVYGQVALFERTGELVCMFFFFRGTAAAWMPDGTRFGPAVLVGGPSSPDALGRIGRALARAWESGEETQV